MKGKEIVALNSKNVEVEYLSPLNAMEKMTGVNKNNGVTSPEVCKAKIDKP